MIEVKLQRLTKPPRNVLIGAMTWPEVRNLGAMVPVAPLGVCATLEDSLVFAPGCGYEEIKQCVEYGKTSVKVPKWTAIPASSYHMRMSWSQRWKRMLPELLDVEGFTGIRFHPGDTVADTDGCIILGEEYKPGDMVRSRETVERFCAWLTAAERSDEVWLRVFNPEQVPL